MKINIFGCLAAAMWATLFVFAVSDYINFSGEGSAFAAIMLTVAVTFLASLWEAWMSDGENWRNKK